MDKIPEHFYISNDAYDKLRDLTKWAKNTPAFIKDSFLIDNKFSENLWVWQHELFSQNVKGSVPDPEVNGFVVSSFKTTGPFDNLWAVLVDINGKHLTEVLIYRDIEVT